MNELNRTTVFIDLKGYLNNYVKTIYTKSTTGDKNIHLLKSQINVAIKKAMTLPATADNCKILWESLKKIVDNANIQHKEYDAYKEIIEAVDSIGYSIAYMCKRTNGGWKYRPITIYPDYNDDELLLATKIILLNLYNEGTITDTTHPNTPYHYMSDEDLLAKGKQLQCEIEMKKQNKKAVEFVAKTDNNNLDFFKETV